LIDNSSATASMVHLSSRSFGYSAPGTRRQLGVRSSIVAGPLMCSTFL